MSWQRRTSGAVLLLCILLVAGCGPAVPPETQNATPAQAVRVLVAADGMYRLSLDELRAVVPEWGNIDPQQLHLRYRGQAYPLWIERNADTAHLSFYGQASQERHAPQNVYWLEYAEQAPESPDSPPPVPTDEADGEPDTVYTATLHLEQNLRYDPLVDSGDHWLWQTLRAPQSAEFDLPLSDVAPGAAVLTVDVWAETEAPQEPDHHLRLVLNGELIADVTWDGAGHFTAVASLPDGVLTAGSNTLVVAAPGESAAAVDILSLDRIRLDYPRFLVADHGELVFDSAGDSHALDGFDGSVSIVDITNVPTSTRMIEMQPQDDGSVRFTGAAGQRYIAVDATGYRAPAGLEPVRPTHNLRRADLSADYVAVGPPDLLAPLEPLLNWRAEHGLTTLSVPLDDIYNQFSHGIPGPEGVRAFLRYASQTWQTPPRYLLLVGDYSYDPWGSIAPAEANRTPTFFTSTVYGGETASDVAFAYLDEDLTPDLAVGRIPAREAAQVQTVVDKTLTYEQQEAPATPPRLLAVADNQEASFRSDAQNFLGHFPNVYTSMLLSPEAGSTDIPQQVTAALAENPWLVAYFGHGSIRQWGQAQFFDADMVADLSGSERLPVMLHFTCLTGLFTHPDVQSLTETLLWQPDSGAVAVLAPTSLTLPSDQSFLVNGMAEALLDEPDTTLGTALLRAWQVVATAEMRPARRDVAQTFLLFGDPALGMHTSEE